MSRNFLSMACRSFLTALLAFTSSLANAEDPGPVPTLKIEELRQKYAVPQSRFLEVDGLTLHYLDEGEGPVVLLLHASFNSLRSWDPLVERLKQKYRVVRFDFPNSGLSVDQKPAPPEKFSMMGRYVNTIEHVVQYLDLERFAVVATSIGGATGFRYTSDNPDKVERLVLINTAGMPRTARTNPLRERDERAVWAGMKIRPRDFWEFGMSENFIAPNEPPAWLVDQVYDFARREGRAEKVAEYAYVTGDPESILSRISSPTMIMWGKSNPTVMHLEADVIQHWMTNAPTTIRKYEGLGHYPYIEDLDAIYPDLTAFLAGDLDQDLRRTVMVKIGEECGCPHP